MRQLSLHNSLLYKYGHPAKQGFLLSVTRKHNLYNKIALFKGFPVY